MKYPNRDFESENSALSTAVLIARASGMSHDLGKYVAFFQKKLDSTKPVSDPVRHEWLSLQIVNALRKGLDWTDAWKEPLPSIDTSALSSPLLTGREAIDFIIATHHRLPTENDASGFVDDSAYVKDRQCVIRPVGAPATEILDEIVQLLAVLDQRNNNADYWRAVAIYSRIAVIMADHSVSAMDMSTQPGQGSRTKIHANTIKVGANRRRNQSLEWHLRSVGETAADLAGKLATMSPPGLSRATLNRIDTPSTDKRFAWQDKAAGLLKASAGKPTLVFNLAGTGSGKTRANVRAITALIRDKRPVRIAVGLNLRTLTLQTRDAFKNELQMSADELACIIGSRVSVQLHDADLDDDENLPETDFIVAPSDSNSSVMLPEFMSPFVERSEHLEPLLATPVAVCTTDYLVAAGEPDKQGHHAMAMLRLMHSELILDEIDSYDPKSFIAVLRIVVAAAMWGRHVVVSSATLSPVVASAVFEAYQCGHRMYGELTGESDCWSYALIDDALDPEMEASASATEFVAAYKTRVRELSQTLTRCHRPGELQKIPNLAPEFWQSSVVEAVSRMHDRHAVDVNGIRVSVGLVRCANIKPAVALTRHISSAIPTARLCCYHSQHMAIQRFHIEKNLDMLLTRKESQESWKKRLSELDEVANAREAGRRDLQLIVVATPVEEIGRDHDFDWAVIEPSSAQSIVQTAGRVNRHRLVLPKSANVAIMQFPYKLCAQAGITNRTNPTFSKPGFETERCPYPTHDLNTLLNWDRIEQIDARIRFESHPLARYDDKSIMQSIKTPMNRILGRANHSASWMSKQTYEKWPLREHALREEWKRSEDGSYYKSEYIGHKMFKRVEQSQGDDFQIVSRTPNDWLVLDLSEQITLSVSKGILVEDGLSVSVPTNQGTLIHDVSFGFYR